MTHHADGPDGHHAVTPVAVGPGIPAGVLSLLQHEHLSAHVLHLITHPAGEEEEGGGEQGHKDEYKQHSNAHRLRMIPNPVFEEQWRFEG